MKFGYTPYTPNMCHHMFFLLRVIFSEGCGKVSRRWWETNHWEQPNHCESWAVQCIQFFLEAPLGLESLPHDVSLGDLFGFGGAWFPDIFFVEHLPLPVCRFAHSSMHSEDTYNLLICKHILIYTYCNMCNWMNQAKCLSKRETVQYFQILQTNIRPTRPINYQDAKQVCRPWWFE